MAMAAGRQSGKRNESSMVRSLIQVDLPSERARNPSSPGAGSSASRNRFNSGYLAQDIYHQPAAGMPSASPSVAPSSPMDQCTSPPGPSSGYSGCDGVSETSWRMARSHQDYEAPRQSVYGNQFAEAQGRDRMYNSRNSPLPGNESGGHKVGPLDRRPQDDDPRLAVLAPSSKTSCLAELGKSSLVDGHIAEENHRRGRSDMYSAHLSNEYRPKVTNVLEEKPEAAWVKRKTVAQAKAAWSKVSPPKQEKVPQYQDTLRTLHRTSLEQQPEAAVKRGEHRKAPLEKVSAAGRYAKVPETPGPEPVEATGEM